MGPFGPGPGAGLLAAVLGGPRTAAAVEKLPKDTAAMWAQVLKRDDQNQKMDNISGEIDTLTDELQRIKEMIKQYKSEKVRVDPIEKDMQDPALTFDELRRLVCCSCLMRLP